MKQLLAVMHGPGTTGILHQEKGKLAQGSI